MIYNRLIDGKTPSEASKILVKSFIQMEWKEVMERLNLNIFLCGHGTNKRDSHDPRVLFYGTWLIENSDIPPEHFDNPNSHN